MPQSRSGSAAVLYTAPAVVRFHPGAPCRGCRLVTALLLQRRSVEFDPLPRHQVRNLCRIGEAPDF